MTYHQRYECIFYSEIKNDTPITLSIYYYITICIVLNKVTINMDIILEEELVHYIRKNEVSCFSCAELVKKHDKLLERLRCIRAIVVVPSPSGTGSSIMDTFVADAMKAAWERIMSLETQSDLSLVNASEHTWSVENLLPGQLLYDLVSNPPPSHLKLEGDDLEEGSLEHKYAVQFAIRQWYVTAFNILTKIVNDRSTSLRLYSLVEVEDRKRILMRSSSLNP